MKKIISTILCLLIVLITGISFAASSATESWDAIGSNIEVITISWTAHSDGSFANYTLSRNINGCLFYAITNPGSPAPTDNYDITLLNSDGIDVATSELLNRDTTISEDVKFTDAKCIYGTLTVAIANNSQAGAKGVIKLFFGR